jgi:hypothetical protein
MSAVQDQAASAPVERRKSRRTDIVRDAAKELEAAAILREQIADLAAGDEDFIRDTLEGETDLDALVSKLVASIGEDEALAEGLKAHREVLDTRGKRFEDRAASKRVLLVKALEIAGRPTIETPAGTVSLRPVSAKAVQTEPADIPAEFWKPQPPKVDARALLEALKAGRSVPGAVLSNGSTTISIKRS